MKGMPEHGHEAVMVEEVLRGLGLVGAAVAGEGADEGGGATLSRGGRRVVMDCTMGRGGHAGRIAVAMEMGGGGMLVGLDVDPENLKYARKRIEGMGLTKVELRTFHANFGEAGDVLAELGLAGVDGLLADFGVSTNQLLDNRHGLSFNAETSLDMRLDPRIKLKAADLLAQWDEKELATVLQEYAQERYAWRIARKIVQTRGTEPILTTGQLARLVRSVVPPPRGKWSPIDPATRTFQALRMAVNNELESLEQLLDAVPGMMKPGGRGVFLSFHSGEDRLVKQAVRSWEERGIAKGLTKKPMEPGEEETRRNPRSRSAKLRAVEFKSRPAGM